ncbi:MAG: hypothetical protein PQJ60_05255 [Spirochaetales bacterium]|nr:hypothetical protein [Spirochaetales bacterium]
MKRKNIVMAIMAGTALLFGGCSTLMTESRAASTALALTDSVNEGEADTLIGSSSRPFLFESEILPSEAMLDDLWQGLIDAGVTFDDPQVKEIRVVDGESYRVFAETWEVETWFKNYLSEPAYLVFLDTADQQLVIVLDRNKKNDRPIMGFGEVKQ